MIVALLITALPHAAAPQCAGVPVEAAVADYAGRVQAMDAAGIAALFGDDGQSITGGRTLIGSKAIAEFLAQFAAYRVTAETMTVDTLAEAVPGWRTDGHFTQTGNAPDGTAYSAQGRFSILWRCDPKLGWRVRHMETTGD